MLDESICHRGVGSIFSLSFCYLRVRPKILEALLIWSELHISGSIEDNSKIFFFFFLISQ